MAHVLTEDLLKVSRDAEASSGVHILLAYSDLCLHASSVTGVGYGSVSGLIGVCMKLHEFACR